MGRCIKLFTLSNQGGHVKGFGLSGVPSGARSQDGSTTRGEMTWAPCVLFNLGTDYGFI